jgi:hypothetical protein
MSTVQEAILVAAFVVVLAYLAMALTVNHHHQ